MKGKQKAYKGCTSHLARTKISCMQEEVAEHANVSHDLCRSPGESQSLENAQRTNLDSFTHIISKIVVHRDSL